MPRPERPLNPLAGPVHAFAAELRELRAQAGSPKYLQMARRTGKSRTALAEAAGGDHLPTWETVEAYVRACGADLGSWRVRWNEIHRQVHPEPGPRRPPTAQPSTPPARSGSSRPQSVSARNWRPAWVGVLTALAILYGPTAAMTLILLPGERTDNSESVVFKTVRITNTDSTPVYLSTTPLCAPQECRVPDIELWPRDRWAVFCYTSGASIEGPYSHSSNGWYGSLLSKGRIGYLPDVNVTDEFHGNPYALPQCPEIRGSAPAPTPAWYVGRRVPR